MSSTTSRTERTLGAAEDSRLRRELQAAARACSREVGPERTRTESIEDMRRLIDETLNRLQKIQIATDRELFLQPLIDGEFRELAQAILIVSNMRYCRTRDQKYDRLEELIPCVQALNIELSSAFVAAIFDREELNTPRVNPRFDRLFGIKRTSGWQQALGRIREDAARKLRTEIEGTEREGAQRELVRYHLSFNPLFVRHRANVFKGFFDKPRTCRELREEYARFYRM